MQPRYSLLFREIERELLPLAGEEGLGVIPYNPIAGGLLSGKHSHNAAPAEGTRFTLGTAGRLYERRYWHDREFTTVDQLTNELPQLEMAFDETLRLYPPVWFGPRMTTKPFELGGHHIPAAAHIIHSSWASHRWASRAAGRADVASSSAVISSRSRKVK